MGHVMAGTAYGEARKGDRCYLTQSRFLSARKIAPTLPL